MKIALSGSDLDILSCPSFRPINMAGTNKVVGTRGGCHCHCLDTCWRATLVQDESMMENAATLLPTHQVTTTQTVPGTAAVSLALVVVMA